MGEQNRAIASLGSGGAIPPTTEPDLVNCQVASLQTLHLVSQSPENEALLHQLKLKIGLSQLIGESPTFLAEIRKIPIMARREANVLISGETGTGKEVCARAIHYLSSSAMRPFVPVNCGAIPADLVENELFGHERGAYTGAGTSQRGVIAAAEGGMLFLDEIDSLPLLAQVKLLRFLQEKEFRPLGSNQITKAAVRIIAATNANLEQAMQQGRFRRDLYYRLNILSLVLPALHSRPEDIIPLAQHFLTKFAEEFTKPVRGFSPDALHLLSSYSWPGNVRELEHTVERAVALTQNVTISSADFTLPVSLTTVRSGSFHAAKAKVVADFEKTYLQEM